MRRGRLSRRSGGTWPTDDIELTFEAMRKENGILEQISTRMDDIRHGFAVRDLWLFGSAIRGELSETSDVDVLVEYEGPATFDRYMDLKFFLEDLLGRKVDLVTKNALRPRLRPAIEREAVRVPT